MLWLSRLRLRFRSLRRSAALDEELAQELAFHLAEQKAEFLALGMNEADAAAAARRAFGPVTAIGEQCRDRRRMRWLADLAQDTRFAVRSFWKMPAFTATVALTLALGIGANTALFSTAYGILFRPLPYPAPERLITMESGIAGVGPVTALREMARAADYAGYFPDNELNWQRGGEAIPVRAAAVTWNLSRVLGVAPARGRWIADAEERGGAYRVAVVSDRLWRERFAADSAIVGRQMLLNEERFEIVGVMPPGFAFPSPDTELWIPIRLDSRNPGYLWGDANLLPVGRLRDGMMLAGARAELAPAIGRIRGLFPWRMPDAYGSGAQAVPFGEALAKDARPKLLALSAAALLLLLISCGNVANLLLARAVDREREFAMREALGAGRGRLLRQALAEQLVLGGVGGAFGLLLAVLLLQSLPKLLPPGTPRLHEITANPSLLGVAAVSLPLTLCLFGAAPMIRLWRPPGREPLAGRATTASKRTAGFSLALIGGELALATLLLIGAGLMGRTLWRLAQVDTGVSVSGIVTARLSAGPRRCGTPERCWAMLQDLRQALLGLPGARSVNWSSSAPLDGRLSAVSVDIEDHPKPLGAPAFVLWQTAATPGYFHALGIPLRAGRVFADTGIVISESTAKRFWPAESAIGKRIRPVSHREWRTVTGVVADVAQYSLAGFPAWVDGAQYVPLIGALPRTAQTMQLTLFVESSEPQLAAAALPGVIRGRFADTVVSRVEPLERIRFASMAGQRSTAWLLGLLAALGLALGIAGVYGVVSHRAAQRRREIGIRMAMGATAGGVVGMIVRETLGVSVAGCVVGAAAAYGLSRYLESLLFGVTAHDAVAFAVAPAVLLMAALGAAAVPGMRASRVDPAITLREE